MAVIRHTISAKDREFLSLLDTKGLSIKQKKFLCVFHTKLANVSQTCRVIGVSRARYYQWLDELDNFRDSVQGVIDGLKDDVESKIYQKIFVDGDNSMIIHYSRTKMKDRGYGDEIKNNTTVTVKNEYAAFTDDELDAAIEEAEKKAKG